LDLDHIRLDHTLQDADAELLIEVIFTTNNPLVFSLYADINVLSMRYQWDCRCIGEKLLLWVFNYYF